MSVKQDVLRTLSYGKDAYYQAIQAVPSYAKQLARVRTDYNERQWIDFGGFLPKFPAADFEKRRLQYQAKYGASINIPGFSDVVHLIPKATISAEERAAHLWATERGLPSPLTPAQLETMKYKKFRFLKALASPTPTYMKNYGAVATLLDNVEDALVTIAVLGRIAAKIAPRLLGRLIPGLGWVLLGSDVLNAVNLISWAGAMNRGCKGLHGAWQEKNPFHATAKARRTLKLQRSVPTFGEFLEIAQTTDQLFGFGLCLGGIMGMVQETGARIHDPERWKEYDKMIQRGNINEISSWVAKTGIDNYDRVKRDLQDQFKNFRDEAYRLQAKDIEVSRAITNWVRKRADEVWGWIKTPPQPAATVYADSLIGAMIISTGRDDFLEEDHTKAYMMLNSAISGVIHWWIENDPLTNFKNLRDFKFRAPAPKDPTTIDMLREKDTNWEQTVKWPHLDTEYATIEEITFNYAPKIKDSFQAYALSHRYEYDAMVAGEQIVDFTKNVIRAFSDDNQVTVGYGAYMAAAIDMMDQVYIMQPDTPKATIDRLADYIGNQERATTKAPAIKDIASFGESIGIKWERSFPSRAFPQAAEIFPEWSQIQDQLDELYVPD